MATKISSPPAEDAMSASKVLGDQDLLGEILCRVDSPSSLVCAALVSKRWLRAVSGRDFLHRFRALHPPRLLGFYVTGDCVPRPEFVSMPAPQLPDRELRAALRSASRTGFDAFPEFSSRVWDCRNGRVLFDFTETVHGRRRFGLRDPMRYPDRGVAELPSPPSIWPGWPHAMLLPDDGEDDASCYRVDVDESGGRVSVQVSVLRSGAWNVHCSASAELASTLDRITSMTLLAGGKLYMVTMARYVLVLDLAAASIFFIDLPEGVGYEYYGNLVLSRGDGSGSDFYLFHMKGHQLGVWLRNTAGHGAGSGEWVLKHSIPVCDTCGHLIDQGSEPTAVGSTDVVGVVDNAEFVFMELNFSGVVVSIHLGSRKVEKVYQRHPDNDEIIDVLPFMTIWPPVFPALLDADEGEPGPHE